MKILFFSTNSTINDPLVNRLMITLQNSSSSFETFACGVRRDHQEGVSQSFDDTIHHQIELWFIRISRKFNFIRLPLLYFEFILKALTHFKDLKPDLIYCFNFSTLIPTSLYSVLNSKTKVIYHARELESEQTNNKLFNKSILWLEKLCVKSIDFIITPSQSSTNWYKNTLKFNNVITLYNAPLKIINGFVDEKYFNTKYNIDFNQIIFIHSGNLCEDRNIDVLIKVFTENDVGQIVFIGSVTSSKYGYIKNNNLRNVHYHEPIEHKYLVSLISKADIGFSLIENNFINDQLALANKFLEYVNAGIPIISSDIIEQASLTKKYNLGISINPTYSEILNAIEYVKTNIKCFYTEVPSELTWNNQEKKLIDLVNKLTC